MNAVLKGGGIREDILRKALRGWLENMGVSAAGSVSQQVVDYMRKETENENQS